VLSDWNQPTARAETATSRGSFPSVGTVRSPGADAVVSGVLGMMAP
jgi:hypothetical protein